MGPSICIAYLKSKVPLEPGTSVLVSITPVADPNQPAPIRAKAGRRKPLPRGAKWPRNSDGNPDSPQVVVFLATIIDVAVGS